MGSRRKDQQQVASSAMYLPILLQLLALATSTPVSDRDDAGPVPVVLWHGMGDSAAGMVGIANILEDNIPGVYVHRIMIGGNLLTDTESGFFRDTNRQIREVCQMIAEDPELAGGYNAIGFPQCPGEMNFFCDIVRDLLNYGAYVDFVQEILVQAQYWHDPLHFDTYVEKSKFIAEINNEKAEKNETYAVNLASLENFVMVKHNQDGMVEPRESEHFEFYTPGQSDVILPLRESPIYVEDRIGLKALDESGRLHFLDVEGDHLQFTRQWFIDNIINVFLGGGQTD